MAEDNQCQKCEYNIDELNSTRETLKYMRDRHDIMSERYDQLDNKLGKIHQIIKKLREDTAMKFRKKELKSVKDFNTFLREYGSITNGHISEIKAEDMYSAKVNIVIDGTYVNNERSIEALKNAILSSIRLENNGDGMEVKYIEIDNVYDVEEFSSSEEG